MQDSSKGAGTEPKALCLDLFGTIVFFDASRLPTRLVGDELRVVTIDGVEELLASVTPNASLARFYGALSEESRAIGEAKQQTLREISTGERFRRALARLGAVGPVVEVASTMAMRHMATLADGVVCPADRAELLRALASRYPLALVSNFDDAGTARRLLDRFDLTSAFSSILISEEVGFVKPAKEIFLAACASLGVEVSNALHVGDSMSADVEGARGAGLGALWIDAKVTAPTSESIADLADLPRWLANRYG